MQYLLPSTKDNCRITD